MGFNLGAFSAGVLGGVADTVTKQRKDIDSRIDKYLDFGVQRGTEIMDKRVEEKKQYINLGNQLKQRELSNDQVAVILEGGLESATSFLDSIRTKEKSLPTGETVDASSLVTMQGKPSGVTWEDYVDQTIMGTVNTSDVYSNTGVAPVGGSILNKMFGDTTPKSVSSASVRNRAGLASGLGYSVEESLAASSNSFDRQRDDKVAQGLVRYAGDPVAQQALLTSKQQYQYAERQLVQINALITSTAEEEKVKVSERKLRSLESQRKYFLQKFVIRQGMDKDALLVEHEKMLRAADLAKNPQTFEGGAVYFGMALRDEMRKPEEKQDKNLIESLTADLATIQIQAALYYNAKAPEGASEYTNNQLNLIFNQSLIVKMNQKFGADKAGAFKRNEDGSFTILDKNNKDHFRLFGEAKKEAAQMWMEITQDQGVSGKPYELLKAVYSEYLPKPPPKGEIVLSPEDKVPDMLGGLQYSDNIGSGTEDDPITIVKGMPINTINSDYFYTIPTNTKNGVVNTVVTGATIIQDLTRQNSNSSAAEVNLISNDFILPPGLAGGVPDYSTMSEIAVERLARQASKAAKKYIADGDTEKAEALIKVLSGFATKVKYPATVNNVIATLSSITQ